MARTRRHGSRPRRDRIVRTGLAAAMALGLAFAIAEDLSAQSTIPGGNGNGDNGEVPNQPPPPMLPPPESPPPAVDIPPPPRLTIPVPVPPPAIRQPPPPTITRVPPPVIPPVDPPVDPPVPPPVDPPVVDVPGPTVVQPVPERVLPLAPGQQPGLAPIVTGPLLSQADLTEALADELLVELRPGLDAAAAGIVAADYGLSLDETLRLDALGTIVFRYRMVRQRTLQSAIEQLSLDPRVITAQPVYIYLTSQAAAAPARAQYALERIRAREAQALANGRGVRVAVIDTSIDDRQPALEGRVVERHDVTRGEAADPGVHGTALAGVIAAQGTLTGMAPGSALVAIRAFTPDPGRPGAGRSTTEAICKAIDLAIASKSRVVNLSFAGPRDPLIARLVRRAQERGVVVVAAVGNEGADGRTRYPAAFEGVIAVTATDARDRLYEQANRGRHVTVAAPGVDVVTTAPGGAVAMTSGTSIATAYVSGLAAILLERRPEMTPAEVRAALVGTAEDLGPAGRDDQFGAGRVDAFRAVSSDPATLRTVTR